MKRSWLSPLFVCGLVVAVAFMVGFTPPVDAGQGPSIPQRVRALERRATVLEARRAHYNLIIIPGTASDVTTDSLTGDALDLKATDEIHALLFATAAYSGAHSSVGDVYNALNNGTVGGQVVDVMDPTVASTISCSIALSSANTLHVDCAGFNPNYLTILRYR